MKRDFTKLFLISCSSFILGIVFLPNQLKAQVYINEFSAANWMQFADDFNHHEDWIELYNAGSSSIDISGYYLSDNPQTPAKYKIPIGTSILPKSFQIFWLSGRDVSSPAGIHTNFKLTQTNKTPETLVLSDPFATIIDLIDVTPTQVHQSRGRKTDGDLEWGIFTEPTLGSSNNSSYAYRSIAKTPKMSKKAGYYDNSVWVNITTSEADGTIYYTTDGSEPDQSSAIYSDSINITQTTVLKAKVFTTDTLELPSFSEFNTYFINVSHTIPVVSISGSMLTDLANGDNSLRPLGYFEYFGADKTRKASGGGEFNSHGQDSWANDQRSLDWITRDEFGYSSVLKEKFFSLSDRKDFQRIILRAAGDDNYPAANHPQNEGSAHIRDAYVHNMAKRGGLSLDVRIGEKAIVYLNGQYWGVYDLREIPDDTDFTKYYYNQDKYHVEYIETWGGTWVQFGDPSKTFQHWYDLYNFIFTNDLSIPDNYAYLTSQYDVSSLVDYVLVNSFTVCTDWLNYNTGWWRGLSLEGTHQKWGYILWDNDATFGHYINYTGVPDQSPQAKPCNPETLLQQWQDPEGHIKILNKLRENPEFNQYYLSRQVDLMNTTFGCKNMLSELDTIVKVLTPEMAQHAQRWFGNYNQWQQNVEKLRTFIEDRCAYFAEGLVDCYDMKGPYQTVFMVDPPDAGLLSINSLGNVITPWTANYMGGIDTKLYVQELQPNLYKFDKWVSKSQTFLPDATSLSTSVNIASADTIIAKFKLITATNNPNNQGGELRLSAFPSPFSGNLNIRYTLPESSAVSIILYNTLGKEVKQLLDTTNSLSSGEHEIIMNPETIGLMPGTYIVKLISGKRTQTQKIIYIHQ